MHIQSIPFNLQSLGPEIMQITGHFVYILFLQINIVIQLFISTYYADFGHNCFANEKFF